MNAYTTIGVLAHVDAGKTTLSEQILFQCGALRKPGRVDHQDTLLDSDRIERRRGITVFSGQAQFSHGGRRYFLLDTPGHADLSPEMERTLGALDYAILVVSGVDGIQAHTETIWRLLAERGVPVFFFLNKTDLPNAEPERVLAELQQRCSPQCILLDEGFTPATQEQVALADEERLEQYLGGQLDEAAWEQTLRQGIRERIFFPVYTGSALQGLGIEPLLQGLDRLTDSQYDPEAPLSGLVYQIRHDNQNNRVALLKLTGGRLRPKETLLGEKIHELRSYQGEKYTVLPQAEAGELVAATGLNQVKSGTAFGGNAAIPPLLTPLLTAQVLWPPDRPQPQVLESLRILEEEEPALQLRWNQEAQELHLAVMGPIQLEVLQETAQNRFGLPLTFGQPQVLYRETIRRPVLGCGHFEPLRHYAEVHLLLEPGPRGSGVTFQSLCSTDRLAGNWQRLIGSHVLEREHPGALAGCPVTDIRVSLLDGAAHLKHTEGGDFREATYRAIRQGLFQADSLLLEPFYGFLIQVPTELAGRVLADIQQMQGEVQPPQPSGGDSILLGAAPVSEMMEYAKTFPALTRGRGRLQLRFDGYRPCHNMETVLAQRAYDREADRENPADSVFCSHGAGHLVHWTQAAAAMHCHPDRSKLPGVE